MRRRLLTALTVTALVAGLTVAGSASPARAADCGAGSSPGANPVVFLHGYNTKSPTIRRDWRQAADAATEAGGTPTFFDYAAESLTWPERSAAPGRLRTLVECLAVASRAQGGGGKVALVAHSMGGLVVRAAFAAGLAPRLVSGVLTIATPHEGAAFSTAQWPYLGAVAAALCKVEARATTRPDRLDRPNTSWPICQFTEGFVSDAAAGMAAGSADITRLEWFPDSVPVHLLIGGVRLCRRVFLWSGPCLPESSDPAVAPASGLAHLRPGRAGLTRTTVPCRVEAAFWVADVIARAGEDVPCSHGPIRRHPTTLEALRRLVDAMPGPAAPATTAGPGPSATAPPTTTGPTSRTVQRFCDALRAEQARIRSLTAGADATARAQAAAGEYGPAIQTRLGQAKIGFDNLAPYFAALLAVAPSEARADLQKLADATAAMQRSALRGALAWVRALPALQRLYRYTRSNCGQSI